jgi:hypothetical protein
MSPNLAKFFSQCQNALQNNGYFMSNIELPKELLVQVKNENFNEIDAIFSKLLAPKGDVFNFLKQFCPVESIEHIISLRDAKNEWEEDGIWHDDGSRILAFSLSLTITLPEGGVLEFKHKDSQVSNKITTPDYGTIIVFKTGIDNYEHKINQVTKGKRLIIAGWCYDNTDYL